MSMLDAFFNSRGFKGAKCKTLLKLTIPRIKLLRNRREIQLKQMRRDIAKLLENGQEATARIRVEHIIREENMMAAQEILELLCELIAVRLPIIETQRECPLDLKEAISSICFAAPRCSDLPELQQVQMMFAAKYGREFVAAATELMPDCGVNRQIIELLSVRAPVMEAKLKLLKEIAEEHEVDWDPAESNAEFHQPHEDLLNGPSHIIDGSALPLPKEKHDDSISSGHTQEHGEEDTDTGLESLNLPEVPKASVQPTPGNPSVPDFSPHVMKFPPHLSDSSLNESKSSDNLGDEFINPMSENKQFQFVPFVASPPPPPFTLPSDESEPTSVHHHDQTPPFVASPPPPPFSLPSDESEPIFVTSHATLSSKQTDPTPFIFHDPPSLSHSKSEANIDLQDVLAAAQAAADSADRAAAAARAAASLAQVRISKLIEKKNEDKASENSAGNPTFDQVNVFDHTDHIPCYEDSGDLHKVEGGSPDTVQYCHQLQRYVSLEEDPYFSYPNLFTRQESGIEPGGHSSDERS